MHCIRAWEDRAIYPNDYLMNLQNKFLGFFKRADDNIYLKPSPNTKTQDQSSNLKQTFKEINNSNNNNNNDDFDVDGKLFEEDESIDGKPCKNLLTFFNFSKKA